MLELDHDDFFTDLEAKQKAKNIIKLPIYSLKMENKSIQKKHLEQFLVLNPSDWDEVAIETINGELTQTLKCIGFINTRVKSQMIKYYIFTNGSDKIFKFVAKDWTVPKSKQLSEKTVYCKNSFKTFGSNEEARQYETDNRYILLHKLNETQIFI